MEWQPIETAPRDDTRILVFLPSEDGYMTITHWEELYNFGIYFFAGKEVIPSHWMPLPETPTN